MRAKEFITEENVGSLTKGVKHALAGVQAFPDLKNQDAYLQYRFGIALAAAMASKEGVPFNPESAFGENMIMAAYSSADQEIIDLASKLDPHARSKKILSTMKSEEAKDIDKTSPMLPRKKNKHGV